MDEAPGSPDEKNMTRHHPWSVDVGALHQGPTSLTDVVCVVFPLFFCHSATCAFSHHHSLGVTFFHFVSLHPFLVSFVLVWHHQCIGFLFLTRAEPEPFLALGLGGSFPFFSFILFHIRTSAGNTFFGPPHFCGQHLPNSIWGEFSSISTRFFSISLGENTKTSSVHPFGWEFLFGSS